MRWMDVVTTRVALANQWAVFVRCNGTAADVLKTPACAVIKMGVFLSGGDRGLGGSSRCVNARSRYGGRSRICLRELIVVVLSADTAHGLAGTG